MNRLILGILCVFLFGGNVLFAEQPASPPQPSAAILHNILTKLKLKGRVAAGYLKGETSATFQSGSFDVPDMKLGLNFIPDDKNSLTARFDLKNAAANAPLLDYLFIQAKDFVPFLKDTPWSINGRLGRMKLGLGEEGWSNNAVEGALPSNSAGNADASDEGVELSGKFWSVSVSNGSRGVATDNGMAKAWMGKLFYSPWDFLYGGLFYYNSGSLKASQTEASIAGLFTLPTGATHWKRQVFGGDLRYDYQRGKKLLNPPAFSDSKGIVRTSYGRFDDSVTGGAERNGHFGFIEGLYNCTSKIYSAVRASLVDLDGSQTASLNNVTTNHYERYSVGMGYRWSDNTHVKLGYDHNENGGAGTNDANDDLISALLTIQF